MADKRQPRNQRRNVQSPDFMQGFDLDQTFAELDLDKTFQMPDFSEFDANMRKTAEDMDRMSKKMMQDAEQFRKNALAEVESMKSRMDFTKYVDKDGFEVCEGRSKDSDCIVIQRTKIENGKVIMKTEIIKGGKLFFKTSNEEDTYSYRNENDDFVTVRRTETVKGTSHTVSQRRTSYVRRRKKDHSTGWTIVIILIIIATIVYFGFIR